MTTQLQTNFTLGQRVITHDTEPVKGMIVGQSGANWIIAADDGSMLERAEVSATDTSTADALETALVILASHRQQQEIATRAYDHAFNEFLMENRAVIAARDLHAERASKVDAAVRALVNNIYTATGDKRPHKAVQVAIISKVSIPDEATALQWAIDNGKRKAIALHRTTFNKLVEAGEVPEAIGFVQRVPNVKVDSDLSMLLMAKAPSDEELRDVEPIAFGEDSDS